MSLSAFLQQVNHGSHNDFKQLLQKKVNDKLKLHLEAEKDFIEEYDKLWKKHDDYNQLKRQKLQEAHLTHLSRIKSIELSFADDIIELCDNLCLIQDHLYKN